MASLILVRHSVTRQEPRVSSHQWVLTDAGRERCGRLAERLRAYDLRVIVASPEGKAVQTGQIVADVLGLPLETEAGLAEQRRSTAPYGTQPEFETRIAKLLTHPDQLVFGEETGHEACDRFQAAVEAILKRHPEKSVAAVTHGTVMSLFLARAAGVEPVAFWRSLGMPGYVTLDVPGFRVMDIVPEVV